MKNIILSLIIGAGTLAVMQGAETQKQPEAGKPAPDFSLSTSDGSQVSLKDYKGKWVVLYFYPKDMTSGCTLRGEEFPARLVEVRSVRRRDFGSERRLGTVAQGFLHEGRADL